MSRIAATFDALKAKGVPSAGIEKFEGNDVDMVPQLTRLKAAGADTIFLVGNVGPSAQVVKSLDRMGWKVPIVSHWGPAGGRFGAQVVGLVSTLPGVKLVGVVAGDHHAARALMHSLWLPLYGALVPLSVSSFWNFSAPWTSPMILWSSATR